MTESGFYKFGRLAGVKYRKAKWIWESVAGDEDEAIRTEYGVGKNMAAAVGEQTPCDADPGLRSFLDDIQSRLADRVSNRLHRFEVHPDPGGAAHRICSPGGIHLCDEVAGGAV